MFVCTQTFCLHHLWLERIKGPVPKNRLRLAKRKQESGRKGRCAMCSQTESFKKFSHVITLTLIRSVFCMMSIVKRYDSTDIKTFFLILIGSLCIKGMQRRGGVFFRMERSRYLYSRCVLNCCLIRYCVVCHLSHSHFPSVLPPFTLYIFSLRETYLSNL